MSFPEGNPDLDEKKTSYDHAEEIKDATEIKRNVANIDFEAALGENRPNQLGWGHLQLYGFCLLVYLNSTMNGYDGSLMSSINALEEYTDYFHLGGPGVSTGIVFAIWQIAQMVGACFLWIIDWKGRRFAIFVGSLGICVGTIVQGTCTTMSTFVGARFLLSFFSTIACSGAPMYLVEISPPLHRGTVSGMYNTLYYMGSIIASFAVYGTKIHFAGSDLAWRLPIWIQMLCPAIVCLTIWFLPESPRWLVAVDRYDEAKAIIVKHHANGDASHPVVELEMREMREELALRGGLTTLKDYFDFRVLWESKNHRYRTFLVIAISWFGQFSGNNVASYFLPQMASNVGIKDTNTKLLLNAGYALAGWFAATIGARLHDVLGRRTMLLGSTLGMVVALSIMSGTAAGYVNTHGSAVSSASIAWIFIFGMVFAVGYTAMQPIYAAEVTSNQMRAKAYTFHWFVSGAAGFVNTFAAPVAMKNIGFWFYVFFVFWDLFEAVIIYFFFVETRGRTLEQLDEIFDAPNPRKASTALKEVKEVVYHDEKGGVVVAKIEEISSSSSV